MMRSIVYYLHFLLLWLHQELSAFPVSDNLEPVDFPHTANLKGLLNDVCFGSKARTIAHPEECALYYNCASRYRIVPLYMEQNLHECPFPKLFSTKSGKCEMYDQVKCGKRKEPKWECQYRNHWCKDEGCKNPCASTFPSCIGKPDGYNPYREGQNLIFYLECEDERVVRINVCPHFPVLTLFSPITKRCEPRSRIPVEYTKINTICKNKRDGYYPDTFGRCKNYFLCTRGRFASFETCLGSQLFDSKRQTCAEAETICGRCGTARSKCGTSNHTNETSNENHDTSTESVTALNRGKPAGGLLSTLVSRQSTRGLETSTTPSIDKNRTKQHNPTYVTGTGHTDFTGAIQHTKSPHITQTTHLDLSGTTQHTATSHMVQTDGKDISGTTPHTSTRHITPTGLTDFTGTTPNTATHNITQTHRSDFSGTTPNTSTQRLSEDITGTDKPDLTNTTPKPTGYQQHKNITGTVSTARLSTRHITKTHRTDFTGTTPHTSTQRQSEDITGTVQSDISYTTPHPTEYQQHKNITGTGSTTRLPTS